jgi:hypothetical protein
MSEKEKNILLQSRSLIFKFGIKSLTMDDISQRLGISKKTLYLYFENKADLVHKVMGYTINENKESISGAITKDKNAIEELITMYESSTYLIKQLNPSIDFELRKYYPESFNLLENFKNEFIFSSMLSNLQKGIAEKLFRIDIDVAIIAKIYTNSVLETFNTETFPADKFSSFKVLKELFIYHIRGIASKKGLDFLETSLKLNK